MNRPASVKPDNFFLMLYRALCQHRVPLVLRVVVHTLALLTLALAVYAWIVGLQFRHAMQQQADALGQSLLTQTAASATELLAANDILSLNVLLNNLVQNPLVAHAALYNNDNRLLAEAGSRPPPGAEQQPGYYSMPITFQEVTAGRLRINLDMGQFQQPMTISLQNIGLLSLILLLLALIASLRLGRKIILPLLQLQLWLRDPEFPAPGAHRQDEIGDLARQLQARLAPEPPYEDVDDEDVTDEEALDLMPDRYDDPDFDDAPEQDEPFTPRTPPQPSARKVRPVEEPHDALDDLDELLDAELPDTPEPPPVAKPAPPPPPRPVEGHTAVLAVQLAGQDSQRAPGRHAELLRLHRQSLEQVAKLYHAEQQTLLDGSSLLLFHSHHNEHNYRMHALCCGALLLNLSQTVYPLDGSGLRLQLGLSLGGPLSGLTPGDLLLSESVEAALSLAQHSRNLLLIERAIGDDRLIRQRARIHPAASPAGACCVERLLDPYPSMIERQQQHLRASLERP